MGEKNGAFSEGSVITHLQVGPESLFLLWSALDYEIVSSQKIAREGNSSEVVLRVKDESDAQQV